LQQDIIKAVEQVCSILPSQYQSECDTLIQEYGQEIIQVLINKLSPQILCSTIGLCSTNNKVSAVSW